MAYWIQEAGGQADGRNSDHRLFYATKTTDIANLPHIKSDGVEQENDSVAHLKCGAGSACLCLETSDIYILDKETDAWQKV